MANQGNVGEGNRLTTIEGRSLALDNAGNLVLTDRTATIAPKAGQPGLVGYGIPYNVAISNVAGATSNLSNVSFQVQDIYGNAIAGLFVFDIWLSDAASGVGLTATTPSGGVAALANAGAILGVETTSKAVRMSTNAAGLATLVITDTAKTGFYPVVNLTNPFPAQVGAQLTAGSYK